MKLKFCWAHKWKILQESFIKSGIDVSRYPGFENSAIYFATVSNKHPAYSDFIKLQKELLDTAFQNSDGSIDIPLKKEAKDKVCERCGQTSLKLQKEINIYYQYLKTSLQLKEWLQSGAEAALNEFWNQEKRP